MENYKDSSDFLNEAIDDFNLNLFKYVIKRSIFWVFIIFLICFGGGFLVNRYSTRIYEANASLILKKNPETMKALGVESILQTDDAEVYREIQLMRSNMMFERVFDSLPLKISYYKVGRTGFVTTEMYRTSPFEILNLNVKNSLIEEETIELEFPTKGTFLMKYSIDGKSKELKGKVNTLIINEDFQFKIAIISPKELDSKFNFTINKKDDVITDYILKLEVSQVVPQTQSIQIKLKDQNSRKAKEIVSALVTSFISFDKERKVESVSNILKFLRHQIDTFENQYNNFQDTVKGYRSINNVFSPEQQIDEIFEKLKILDGKIEELEVQKRTLENIKQNKGSSIEAYMGIFAYSKTGVLSDHFFNVLEELNGYVNEREKLLLDYKATHPSVLSLNAKVDNALSNLQYQIEKSLQVSSLDAKALKAIYDELNNKLIHIPETAMEYDKFKKENENREKFLFNMMDKRAQYLVAEAGIVSDYIILSPPHTLSHPTYPNVTTIRIISLVMFLFLALGLIMLRYFMYQFVTSIRDIKKRLKAPVLGVIPRYNEENMERSKIVVTINPKSKIAEAFRGIRANVQFIANSHDNCKVISTTSTIPGEGKTFVNINLAAIHSVLDKRVILLDLDMRKPRLAKIFGIHTTIGMSTILSGQSEYEDCIQHTNFKNIDVIPSGPVPPNPSELILSKGLDELIVKLKTKYDFIFIDTPPIGLVTDALEILSKCDVPLYVVRADFTKKEFLGNIDRLIVENKLHKLSLVVNDFGRGASGEMYEYGYGYGYTYSQGEGYYTEDKKQKKMTFWDYFKNWKL